MIDELRHYVPAAGRAKALQDRFEHATLALFARAGIVVSDYWIAEASGEIWYIVRWESVAAMEAGWAAFRDNPEWLALRRESEAAGSLVERIDKTVLTRPAYFKPPR
jgi:hypothetical protein